MHLGIEDEAARRHVISGPTPRSRSYLGYPALFCRNLGRGSILFEPRLSSAGDQVLLQQFYDPLLLYFRLARPRTATAGILSCEQHRYRAALVRAAWVGAA